MPKPSRLRAWRSEILKWPRSVPELEAQSPLPLPSEDNHSYQFGFWRKEVEIRSDPGPAGRWRVLLSSRRFQEQVLRQVRGKDGGTSPGQRGPHVRTVERSGEEDKNFEDGSVRRFRIVGSIPEAHLEIQQVHHVCADGGPEVPAVKRVLNRGLSFRSINCKVKFAFELFLFCMVWMLREIEAAMFHVKDLYLDEDKKLVTLSWPVSKMDPEARGVKRTLQCLCGGACSSECPYKVSADLVKKVTNFNGRHSLLAITKSGQGVEKAQVVASWAYLFGMKVGGHSARRTGEVPQVAYLGRWKSSVILSYAQEGLETVPANVKVHGKNGNLYTHTQLQDTKDKVRRDITKLKADMKTADDKVKELSDTFEKCSIESNGALPAFVMSLHSQVVHDNVDTLLTSPPFTWRTKCGWYYSSSHYSFKAEGPATCAKCKGAPLQ